MWIGVLLVEHDNDESFDYCVCAHQSSFKHPILIRFVAGNSLFNVFCGEPETFVLDMIGCNDFLDENIPVQRILVRNTTNGYSILLHVFKHAFNVRLINGYSQSDGSLSIQGGNISIYLHCLGSVRTQTHTPRFVQIKFRAL